MRQPSARTLFSYCHERGRRARVKRDALASTIAQWVVHSLIAKRYHSPLLVSSWDFSRSCPMDPYPSDGPRPTINSSPKASPSLVQTIFSQKKKSGSET
jgi:hypothetical protein